MNEMIYYNIQDNETIQYEKAAKIIRSSSIYRSNLIHHLSYD